MLGSFVSVDPVMDLSDPQQWNAYAYANNNPVTWSDPTGLLLGPLIDGAYTAPTRGKPGSGGWQVAPNNTGYTGTWSNGGAGKWSKPGTSYTPPVTIRHNNTPSAAEKAQAAKAAQERREQRLLRERKTREAAAAEAREAETQKREQKNSWLDTVWEATGTAAEYLTESEVGKSIEFARGFAFGAVGTLCGAVYTAAYARQGKWDKAKVSAVGMIGGGAAGKVVAKSAVKRFAGDLPTNPALSVARSVDPRGDVLGVTDVKRLYGVSYATSNLAGTATTYAVSTGGNSMIGQQ
ncbi:RHS repeat-associated core domain-containing protein [Promicromonospora sp. MS192]|uniref:RHS repeat-associated core domain-containing protein n=1 Tax=Promicromonospora sp. MS192 TaxID=3412684 RepID=UPI003C2AE1D6